MASISAVAPTVCDALLYIINSNDSICFSPTPRFFIVMKLFFFILGFLTFSTAMPSDIGRGQEVPSPESDRNSTQLHLAQPKVAATVEGINQSVEIRQVSPAVIVAIGVPTAGLVAGLVIIATLAVAQSNDDNVRNSWIL